MIETETSFGAWLRRQRLQLDLTQLELAQLVACSVVTIRKLERDELRPSKQLAERLAHYLNIAPEHQAAILAFARGIGSYPQLDATPAYSAPSSPSPSVSLRLRQHNLDVQLAPLVGRETELAELQRLFEQPGVRLVTILGAGGMGKTHLAQEMARRYLDRTQEQVFFIALAAVADAEDLTTAIIDALGYPLQQDGRSLEQQLLDYLQRKQMLLVLDNFEHLLTGTGLVNAILRVAPGVKVLVTSRERLLLSSETLFFLRSLAYPDEATAAGLLDYTAIKLFIQVVLHSQPIFEPNAAEYAAIARICRLVEGMPLGILLAAAWVNQLSVQVIADEISQNLDFLEAELRDLPERHRSIRAVFAHSWRRLAEAERRVFMQLAVFRGGFTRQGAQTVTGASLHQLRTLVNQSLLQVEQHERYSLHELLRQYAEAELTAAEQREVALDQHCAYYAELLAQCAGDLKGSRQAAVLTLMETEHENIRSAWAWAIAHRDGERVAQMLESLGFFYEWRGRFQDGEHLFAQAAATFTHHKFGKEHSSLPRLLTWQATFNQILGRREQASQLLHHALAHINNAGRTDSAAQLERAAILHGLGLVAYDAHDRLESGRLFTESLTLYRVCNDRWGEAMVLLSLEGVDRNLPELANPHQHRQATERSKSLVLESLAIFRQSGNQTNLATALEKLATVLLTLGQAQEARGALTECLAIRRRLDTMNSSFIHATIDLGIAQEYLGLYEQMHIQAQQALALAQAVGDVLCIGRAYVQLSSAALVQQRFDEVEACFHEVTRLMQKTQANSTLNILQLVNCGLASYRLGDLRHAQQQLAKALQVGLTTRSIRGTVHGLLLGALLLVEQGKPALAVELHTLAMCYPFVANSRWCEDVAGRDLIAFAETLPVEITTAARVHGRARDLWLTTAALLDELDSTL